MHLNQGFWAKQDILSKRLAKRGYKNSEICGSISKTFNKNRKELLEQNKTPNSRITLKTTKQETKTR